MLMRGQTHADPRTFPSPPAVFVNIEMKANVKRAASAFLGFLKSGGRSQRPRNVLQGREIDGYSVETVVKRQQSHLICSGCN